MSRSGISRYSEDFYKLILAPLSYEHLQPSTVDHGFIEKLERDTCFHLELGAGQYAERDVLIKLIEYGFININVTLHDPPFITFPFYHFKSQILNRISRGFDWYLNTLGASKQLLKRCSSIYVLSQAGVMKIEARYGLTNVQYIPHIICPEKIVSTPLKSDNQNILFFGFIGPKKGLEYALRLHEEIRKKSPEIQMHVIGEAIGKRALKYFEKLKKEYQSGVIYHGYVAESDLNEIYDQVAHVFLPFENYGYICPVSGSVLNSLRRGKIVWTNPVNAVEELIYDGVNGLFFSSNINEDALRFSSFLTEFSSLIALKKQALLTAGTFGADNVAFRKIR